MREIDTALTKYYNTGNGGELTKIISNPSILLEDGLLPRDSELLTEAEIILDSLNAYNNGIDNSERDFALESIEPNSPLYSWRSLVLAIREFYNSNFHEMTKHINEIHPESPLKPIYKGLLNKSNREIYLSNSELDADIDTLKDVLENNLIDLYPETVGLIVTNIKGFNSSDFTNTLLTIIDQSIGIVPESVIINTISKYTDKKNFFKIMANAYIFGFPVKSIVYWVRYTMCSKFKSINDNSLLGVLSIIRDINKSLINDKYRLTNQEKVEIHPELDSLYSLLDELNPREIKVSPNPLTTLKRYLNFKISNGLKPTIVNNKNGLQGELF